MDGERPKESDYVQYLPAVLQADPFLGQFLLAFEQILSGLPKSSLEKTVQAKIVPADSPDPPGLETLIVEIHNYFNPTNTPAEFLPWLAGWVALSLREDWSESVKRKFIGQIVPLYRERGTKTGLIKMLKLYLGDLEKVSIYDEFERPAHYFQVELQLASRDLDAYRRKERIARAIINQEKPAHTYYTLQIRMPTMRLISAELAQTEKTAMLRIGNLAGYPNNTILGTSTPKELEE